MKKFWIGERSLWQAFWLLFVGGYICILFLNLLIFSLLDDTTKLETIGLVLILVTFAFLAVSLISVWRCSKNVKWQGWAWVARFIVIVVMIRTIYSAYFLFAELIPAIKAIPKS
ncbi:MAG: hypothetical protein C4518_11685 [Desulfobacteraceae bacterium]|nr:MAG: hypothetical protein C4518_11685 [Desulfobacteraceae bacterium]